MIPAIHALSHWLYDLAVVGGSVMVALGAVVIVGDWRRARRERRDPAGLVALGDLLREREEWPHR